MSVKIQWNPNDFPRRIRRHPAALRQTKRDALSESKDTLAKRAVKNLEDGGKTHTRSTVDSIMGGTESLTGVVSDSRAKVGSTRMSAVVLEHGRRAGSRMPNIDAIQAWAGTDRRAAYLIARSISRRGLRPTRFLSRALKQSKEQIQQIVIKVSQETLERLGFK